MKPVDQFIDEIWEKFQTCVEISEEQTRMYFANPENTTKERLAHFFKIRMFNERWNMVEISKKVSELPIDTPPAEARMLAKQAFDEAEHFRLASEVLAHVTGEPVDYDTYFSTHGERRPGYGSGLILKYEAGNDPLALAVYQFLVEGQSSFVWGEMSKVAVDEYVKKRYAKIAKDERAHMNFGRIFLKKLLTTKEAQDRALKIAQEIFWDVYECQSIALVPPTEEMKKKMRESYGEPTRKLLSNTF
jgi:rubrerythrin